jgi:hypothetical protein
MNTISSSSLGRRSFRGYADPVCVATKTWFVDCALLGGYSAEALAQGEAPPERKERSPSVRPWTFKLDQGEGKSDPFLV